MPGYIVVHVCAELYGVIKKNLNEGKLVIFYVLENSPMNNGTKTINMRC